MSSPCSEKLECPMKDFALEIDEIKNQSECLTSLALTISEALSMSASSARSYAGAAHLLCQAMREHSVSLGKLLDLATQSK